MKKVILITGVSSGFGKETAKLLVENGHTVYGTVRTELEEADDRINQLLMDLTSNTAIKNAVSRVFELEGKIDILINNAGMHSGGSIETTLFDTINLQMDTNFFGVVRLTREVLPIMRNQGYGTIINVSSIGGLMGLPFQPYYSATKFALEGFSEALRMEVRAFNIKIVVINPGDFHTSNSANRKNFLAPSSIGDPYHQQFKKTLAVIEKDETNGWNPVILAQKMVKIVACKNPRQRYVIASPEQKLAVVLKYLLPGKLFTRILEDHYKIGNSK